MEAGEAAVRTERREAESVVLSGRVGHVEGQPRWKPEAAPTATYRIVGTKGDVCLDQAYEYQGEREMTITIDDNSRTRTFPKSDQFGPELIYFSNCVLRDVDPEPSGEEGLADVRIIEALLRSARDEQAVRLPPFKRRARPEPRMRLRRPPVREPEPVHADSPVAE